MLLVAAEQLVARIAAERHRAVLPHQPADEKGRDHRGFEHRLVILPGKHVQDVGADAAGLKLDMFGAKRVGDEARKAGFIPFLVARQADREGFDARRGPRRHRGHEAGIDATAEQHADRYVGDQLAAHGIGEQRFQFLDQRLVVVIVDGGFWRDAPIAPHLQCATLHAECQRMGRRQLVDALEDATLTRHVAHHQVAIERRRIDLAGKGRIGHQPLQLRSKTYLIGGRRIEQRFLAAAVAGEKQKLLLVVIKRDGKHAVEMREAIGAPFRIGREQDFGVGLGGELMSLRFQLIAKVEVVVDFPVEHHAQAIALVVHRLMPAGRQVDDGEPALRQSDVSGRRPPRAAIVGTTMHHRGTTGVEPGTIRKRAPRSNADDSAHQSVPFRACR